MERKFKQTNVGLIPETWNTARLNSLTEKIGSGATPRGGKESYQSSGISLIRSQNVLNGRFSNAGLAFINATQAEELDNVEVKPSDVLLNITGDSVARCCSVPDRVLPARVNQHVAIIRTEANRLDPVFLQYFLNSPQMQQHMLSAASAGATRPALTKLMIENFLIVVPSIAEQIKIAQILNELDAKIELNHQMNKILESMAQALFKEWFLCDTGGGDVIPVSELIAFDPTVTVKKGASLPYVDMAELSTEGMTVGNVILKSFAGGSKFQNGDTLLARITPCLENGKTAFVGFLKDQQVGFGSTEFIVMRAKTGISPQFVYCLARDPGFRSFAIQSMVGSSGRQRVQRNMLEGYEIVRPAEALMEKFQKITEPLFQQVSENCRKTRTLSQIRDSLLPMLLNGRLKI